MNISDLKCSILNYGAGNIASVFKFCELFGFRAVEIISNDCSKNFTTDVLIIPGVGSFGFGSSQINSNPFFLQSIHNHVASSKLLIGICLGAQLLLESSDESPGYTGLSYVKGTSMLLSSSPSYKGKVPRIGWNCVDYNKAHDYFYFVHSYHMMPVDPDCCLTTSDGIVAAFRSNSLWGLQFHPEKSSSSGFKFFSYILDSHVKAN